MPVTAYAGNALLADFLGVAAYVPPAQRYLGLLVTLPAWSLAVQSYTEHPSDGQYVRQPVTFAYAPGASPSWGSWPTQQAAAFATAQATVTVAGIGLWDQAMGGNLLWWAQLPAPQTFGTPSGLLVPQGGFAPHLHGHTDTTAQISVAGEWWLLEHLLVGDRTLAPGSVAPGITFGVIYNAGTTPSYLSTGPLAFWGSPSGVVPQNGGTNALEVSGNNYAPQPYVGPWTITAPASGAVPQFLTYTPVAVEQFPPATGVWSFCGWGLYDRFGQLCFWTAQTGSLIAGFTLWPVRFTLALS